MNHQPFETWIFSDDPIKPEEQAYLTEHLQSCEDCRRLSMVMNEIEHTFINTPAPAPAPGFSQRWQKRLAHHRQSRQQQRMWIFTLGLFGVASLLTMVIVLLEWNQINWFFEISKFVANFSQLAARINQFWVVFRSITRTLPIFVPIMLVFGVGSLSASIALIVTWLNAMVQLYQPVK
jgi:predicted anti-sigma-YlaC factor YlaD